MAGTGGPQYGIKYWPTPKAYGPDALDREPPAGVVIQWGRFRKQDDERRARRERRKKAKGRRRK